MIWNIAAVDPRFLSGLGILYAAASMVALLFYGYDKWAAIKGWQRVRERSLHVVALVGGWPGALAAQRIFRHKTRKQPFRRIFWVAVSANLAALLWVLSVNGQAFLNSV